MTPGRSPNTNLGPIRTEIIVILAFVVIDQWETESGFAFWAPCINIII